MRWIFSSVVLHDSSVSCRKSYASDLLDAIWVLLVSLGDFLLDLLPHDVIYVRMRRRELHLRVVGDGREWRDVAALAITKLNERRRVIAVGQSAGEAVSLDPDALELVEPLNHPRSIISDFEAAGELLTQAIRRVLGRRQFFNPVLVMHPLEMLEGGLTKVEHRALLELAEHAGACRGCIWTGRELTSKELRAARKCKTELFSLDDS